MNSTITLQKVVGRPKGVFMISRLLKVIVLSVALLALSACEKEISMEIDIREALSEFNLIGFTGPNKNSVFYQLVTNSMHAIATTNGRTEAQDINEIPGKNVPGYYKYQVTKLSEQWVELTTDFQDKFGNRFFIREKAFFKKGTWSGFVAGEQIVLDQTPEEQKRVLEATKEYYRRAIEGELKSQLSGNFSQITVVVTKYDIAILPITGDLQTLSVRSRGIIGTDIYLER
jgi:hypothetical protein